MIGGSVRTTSDSKAVKGNKEQEEEASNSCDSNREPETLALTRLICLNQAINGSKTLKSAQRGSLGW